MSMWRVWKEKVTEIGQWRMLSRRRMWRMLVRADGLTQFERIGKT